MKALLVVCLCIVFFAYPSATSCQLPAARLGCTRCKTSKQALCFTCLHKPCPYLKGALYCFFYAYCSLDAFALKRECLFLGSKPHSFGELKLISSKFSYTQHSANKFASVFVCTNFPVVAKLVPMSVTQVYLQVTKRVQSSFANAVHCYGFAMLPKTVGQYISRTSVIFK